MNREWLLQMGHTNIRDPYIRDCEPASVLQNSQFKIHDSRFAIVIQGSSSQKAVLPTVKSWASAKHRFVRQTKTLRASKLTPARKIT